MSKLPERKPESPDVLIDWDYLESLGGLESEGLRAILNDFLEQAPIRVNEVSHSIATHDPEKVRSLTHALKGAARMCGLVAIGDLASALEEGAMRGRLPDGKGWSASLQDVIAKSRQALDKRG